jgi:DMSO/TMAO reductase YedYZ heme-binding membrane subunit
VDVTPELTWYVLRASGIVAWALLTLSVVGGSVLRTRLLGPRFRPPWLLDLHRGVSELAVVFTGLHVLAVAVDPWIDLSLVEVLVPFTSSWEPLALAPGIVGLHMLLAIQLTSLFRRRVGTRTWRAVHALALPTWVLATGHLLVAGTDATNVLLGAGVLAATGLMAFVWTVRAALPGRRRRRPRGRAVAS